MMNSEHHFSAKTFASSSSFTSSQQASVFSSSTTKNLLHSNFETSNNLSHDFKSKLLIGNINEDEDVMTKRINSRLESSFGNTKLPNLLQNKNSLLNTETRIERPTFSNSSLDFDKFQSPKFQSLFQSKSSDNPFSCNAQKISFNQSQSSQYSSASHTKILTSKVKTMKITRKIVNGQVVEEEEEIDEIENEPITEHFVVENSSNTIQAELNVDDKNYSIKQSRSCPSANLNGGEIELRQKTKAIEAPRKTKLKSFFSLGKKKKEEVNVGIIQPIINELLTTEEKYVADLNEVVEDYMPQLQKPDAPEELKGDNYHLLFGNIEIICNFHTVQFLTDLKESDKTPEDIAKCFLKHRKEFSLYRHYNRNKQFSEKYVMKYGSFFNSSFELQSFLIKPTQRLGKYILLMENLAKECKKHKISGSDVELVVEMLRAEIRLGNDLMALDAIKECHIDLKDQGDLIYRNEFTVNNGSDQPYKAMVFLFEKIMLFTKIVLQDNVDVLYYKDFIYLKDIGLTECPEDAKKFKVWFHKHTLKPYTLQTSDKKAKKTWVEEIRKQLENELELTKKEQQAKQRTLIDLKKK